MVAPTVNDIRSRFYRDLTADEERFLPSWIQDAEDELMDMGQLRLSQRLARVPPEPGLENRISRVIRAAVLRRLLNPQGRRQYSYTVDDATVSETMSSETLADGWFTDAELAGLMPAEARSGAFSARLDAGWRPQRRC